MRAIFLFRPVDQWIGHPSCFTSHPNRFAAVFAPLVHNYEVHEVPKNHTWCESPLHLCCVSKRCALNLRCCMDHNIAWGVPTVASGRRRSQALEMPFFGQKPPFEGSMQFYCGL